MSLVKCPECGKEISDKSNVCVHCGCPIVTTQLSAINHDVANYLEIARTALESQSGQEAYDYSNKVLAILPNNFEAWYIKMRAVEYLATVGNPKAEETASCAKQVLKFAGERDDYIRETYKFLVYRAQNMVVTATLLLEDTTTVENLTDAVKRVRNNVTSQVLSSDGITLNMAEHLVNGALSLKLVISDNKILENEELSDSITQLSKLFISFHKKYIDRITIYYAYMTDEKLQQRKNMRFAFMSGLPENKRRMVEEICDTGKDWAEANSHACYIATCVYGSYDCPQVWTLRRYRDNTLGSTWYGRLFVKTYYLISPTLVRWFGNKKWFKKLWKGNLDKMVKRLQEKGVASTAYEDKKW